MTMYWTLRSIPELADLPASQRQRLWRTCYVYGFRHWQTWLGLLLCSACISIGVFASILLSRTMPPDQLFIWLSIVPGGLGGGIGVSIHTHVIAHQLRPYLRHYRAKHDL
jgi:hypothetical protein